MDTSSIIVEVLHSVSADLRRTGELQSSLERALNKTCSLINAETGAILTLDPFNDTLTVKASLDPEELFPIEQIGEWLESEDEEPYVIFGDSDALVYPLETSHDLLGVVVFLFSTEAVIDAIHPNIVGTVANQMTLALRNAELYNLVREQAERLGEVLRNSGK